MTRMTPAEEKAFYSTVLHYGYAGMLAVSFLFMSASGTLGHADHTALRWLVTPAALFGVYCSYKKHTIVWLFLLGLVAAVFNPLWHPTGLGRPFWLSLDLSAVLIFLGSFYGLRPKHYADGESVD